MTRRAVALALAALSWATASGAAAADDGWRSEQPPPPPDSAIGVPIPIGAVGDIAFWAPNRGLLTTAGNDAVSAGLYAYDGTGWYQLSTVCGGHDGRIAWAARNEWWTIADQPPGQVLPSGLPSQAWHRSLCRFVDGQVVASYAQPIGTPDSYLPMNAAACSRPDDCWFAGDRLPGTTNVGAFHLHWDGSTLATIPSLTELQPELADPPRTVAALAHHQGRMFESVQVQRDDVAPDESVDQPYVLHELLAGSSNPFLPLFTEQPIPYGSVRPWQLSAFRLSSDGDRLWALAGANSSAAASVIALQLGSFGFAQLPLQDPAGTLPPRTRVRGLAADPGTGGAWVAYAQQTDDTTAPARLTRIEADGSVGAPVELPRAGDGIARKGRAGAIACPAAGQCWVATEQGWLFHLGPALAQDTDPDFHRLVTYRPPDASLPAVPPPSQPIDDSGANLPPDQAPPPSEETPAFESGKRARALVVRIRRRMVHGTTLELRFTLRARARVRLVAKRRGKVVASTRRVTMAKGRRSVRLRLDPRRWPTKLDLQAKAAPR